MSLIKKIVVSVLAIFIITSSAQAETACRAPIAPNIPDGKTATKEEMMTALKAIKKDFQPAIKNFQNCVPTEKAATGDVATPEQIAKWDQYFDAAYALETKVANDMNEAIRAYKARTATKKE